MRWKRNDKNAFLIASSVQNKVHIAVDQVVFMVFCLFACVRVHDVVVVCICLWSSEPTVLFAL